MWVCKRHGKDCRHHTGELAKDLNDRKVTPGRIDWELNREEKKLVERLLKWVDERG